MRFTAKMSFTNQIVFLKLLFFLAFVVFRILETPFQPEKII